MREALLSMLQQKMDGCARDQFWAVAAVSGLNGLLVSKAGDLEGLVPTLALFCAVLPAGAYAVYYIIHRHKSYYRYSEVVADLIADEESVPAWMKVVRRPREVGTWLGTAFYVYWVITATAAGVLVTWAG